MRVAITGARGFIGGHLADALTARGDQAVPIGRPFESRALERAFRDVDAVAHLAGVVSAVRDDEFYKGNVEGTRVVAAAAREADVKLIHVSSLAAAGPAPPDSPRSEDDEPRPVTTYGRTKLEGERIVASSAGLRWTVIRPGVVYGPRDRAVLPLVRYTARGMAPLVGNGSAAYTFLYVGDLIRALLAAIDRP